MASVGMRPAVHVSGNPLAIPVAHPHYVSSDALSRIPFSENTVFQWSPSVPSVSMVDKSNGVYAWRLQVGPPSLSQYSAWMMFCDDVERFKIPFQVTRRLNGVFPGVEMNRLTGICVPVIRIIGKGIFNVNDLAKWNGYLQEMYIPRRSHAGQRLYASVVNIFGESFASVGEAVRARHRFMNRERIIPTINHWQSERDVLPIEGILIRSCKTRFSPILHSVRGPFKTMEDAKHEFHKMCSVLNPDLYKTLISSKRKRKRTARRTPVKMKQTLKDSDTATSSTCPE